MFDFFAEVCEFLSQIVDFFHAIFGYITTIQQYFEQLRGIAQALSCVPAWLAWIIPAVLVWYIIVFGLKVVHG